MDTITVQLLHIFLEALQQYVPMITVYPAAFLPLPRPVVIAVYTLRDGVLHQG